MKTQLSLMRHIVAAVGLLGLGALGVVVLGRVDEAVVARGELRPVQVQPVAPQTAGRVAAVLVVEGEVVGAGQPLLILDDRDLETRLGVLRRELDEQVTILDQLRGDSARFNTHERPQQVRQARAALERAVLARDYATMMLKQMTQLQEHRVVPESDLRLKQYDMDLATAQFRESEAADALLRTRLVQEAEDVHSRATAARCRIAALRERIHDLQGHIAAATVRAPMAGTVITSRPEQLAGLWLDEGQAAIEVADLTELEFVAYVQPRDEHRVSPDLIARVHLDAFPSREYRTLEGTVTHVAARPLTGDGNARFPVAVRLRTPWIIADDGRQVRLKCGLMGRAEIVVRPRVGLARLLLEGLTKAGS